MYPSSLCIGVYRELGSPRIGIAQVGVLSGAALAIFFQRDHAEQEDFIATLPQSPARRVPPLDRYDALRVPNVEQYYFVFPSIRSIIIRRSSEMLAQKHAGTKT